MIELSFREGRQAGMKLALEGSWVTLGRAPQCEVIIDDAQCSWEHCVLERVPAGYLVTDLGSSNGTHLNEQRLTEPQLLTPGDVLRVGTCRIVLDFDLPSLDGSSILEAAVSAPPSVAPSGAGLRLTVISGEATGETFDVTGEWATVGAEASCQVYLPGLRDLMAYLVLGERGYALQPAEEGAQDCLINGAFVGHQALIEEGSIVQFGGVTLRANYGSADAGASAGLTPVSLGPIDATQRLDVADARRLVAEAQRRAAEKRGAAAEATQATPASDGDETLSIAGISDLHEKVAAYAESRMGARPSPTTADWTNVGPNETVVVDHEPERDVEPPPRHLMLRPRLRCVAGPHEGRVVLLGQGVCTLGRDDDNDVVLFDALVSRRHARVIVEEDRARVEDLGGRNPLSINGAPRPEGVIALRQGDLVSLGSSVFEFGDAGVDPESLEATTTIALPSARFIFDGQVMVRPGLTIGRDPNCDLFLDHEDIDRHHAEILAVFNQFSVVDGGGRGVRVNGRRVVDHVLQNNDEVMIGGHRILIRLDGFTCSLDVARPAPTTQRESFAVDAHSADPFRTMYRVALPKVPSDQRQASVAAPDAQPAPPRKKIRWVPPGDVQRSLRGPLLVVSGLLAAGCGVAWMATGDAGGRFVTQPVSAPHDSVAFAMRAREALSASPGCGNCHTAFSAVSAAGCQACHADHRPRPRHAQAAEVGDDCRKCHTEHPAGEAPTALLAVDRCVECHVDRHARMLKVTKGPVRLEAPTLTKLGAEKVLALGAAGSRADRLHRTHQAIERRCAGCHANEDQSGPADPETACLRCHGEAKALEQPCGVCHNEHGHDPERSMLVTDTGEPGPFASVAGGGTRTGVGLALLLFAPLLLVLGLHRLLSDRMAHADLERPDEPQDAGTPKKLLHIDEEMCVGSKVCVEKCPYEVLALIETPKGKKVAKVVNFDSCNECNTCVEVCEPKALTRRLPGAPVPMIERALVDASYLTSVRGLYLIGQAAGKPLVRNAINLGARTIHHIVFDGVKPGAAAAAGLDFEVAIVGGGPAGLSAGVSARQQGLSAVVFEKGADFAQTIRSFHRGKPVQNQPSHVELIGPLWVEDCVREDLLERWAEQLREHPIDLRYKQPVEGVKPLHGPDDPAVRGFEVTTPAGTVTALRVILAVGGGEARKLDRVPGNDLEKIRYQCDDPKEHASQHVAVVGGGNSALEVAIGCAEANGGSNTVRLIYRGADFGRSSKKNKEKVAALVAEGRLILHLESNPAEVTADALRIKPKEGEVLTVENDFLYCMLGKIAHDKWLKSIGVEFVQKPQGWSPPQSDDLSFLELSGQS